MSLRLTQLQYTHNEIRILVLFQDYDIQILFNLLKSTIGILKYKQRT